MGSLMDCKQISHTTTYLMGQIFKQGSYDEEKSGKSVFLRTIKKCEQIFLET